MYGNTFWYCYNYEAADESGKNQWCLENETHKLGNYWSYNKAPDNDGDGITDAPYHIATTTGLEILDKYPLARPLVNPYQTPSTTTSTQPPRTITPPQNTTQVETKWSKTQTSTQITSPGVYTSSTTQETSGVMNTQYIVISSIGVVFILVIVFILLRARRNRSQVG